MSKILMYTGATTGVTTSEGQHAFFINENGLPAVKSGSQTIVFSTSGAAFTGSSGSSGANGSSGLTGTSGVSGTSGQDGAPGDTGSAGASGTSGESGTSGINGVDGAVGTSGTSGVDGTFFGSSGSSGVNGSSGSSGSNGSAGGYSQWTPIVSSGITASVNSTFIRTNTGGVWNEGFASEQGFEVAYVSANPTTSNNRCVIGLNSDPSTDNSYTSLDYCIGITAAGVPPTIYESGSLVYTHSTGITTNTLYTVTYDGYNVKYYIDSTLVWTTARAKSGLLYLDSSLYTGGGGSGFKDVVFGPYSLAGASGSSGSSGATGSSGVSGTSGTSAGGGGGSSSTRDNILISYTGQTQYDWYGTLYDQWKTTYMHTEYYDRGTGSGNIDKVWGYIVPFVLKPGEQVKKIGAYINSKITGTANVKLAVFNNHPKQDSPYQKLQETQLTVTCPGYSDLVWSTWDYTFTNTGTTENQFWFMMLYPIRANNDFEFSQGYRETYNFRGNSSVYPLSRSNQFMVFDDTMTTYNTIPDWSYFITNNSWPTLKATLGNDRTLPLCWQTDLN